MHHQAYPVGLLLWNAPGDASVMAVDALLETAQSTQWVGVFTADMIERPLCRNLIVQHLFDYHTWPIDPFRLNHTLGHAYGYAGLNGRTDTATTGKRDMALIGHSAAIQHLRRQIAKMAHANAPVLIWGESGSGKELTAQAIHQHSPRASGPFIAVNCGAIPASLIESASGGTLFLDEIGDLKLLADHFFKVFAHDKNPRLTGFSNRALQAIQAYDWPGNVRELINRIRRALVMSEGRLITAQDLDLPEPPALRNGEALEDACIRAERDAIQVCLQDCGNNITHAARDLGVSRMTLYRLIEKHHLAP